MLKICYDSYHGAMQATSGGVEQIELNCALHLSGFTPSLASPELVKEHYNVKVIAMVRPKGGGFCYSEEDFNVMLRGCEHLVCHGVDGIAFGRLREDASIDRKRNIRTISIIHNRGKGAVFRRAFGCTSNPYGLIETLIGLGVDHLLTSGLKPKVAEGEALLGALQSPYGNSIEILARSGINVSNARTPMGETGIRQVHGSCRGWMTDPTTTSYGVTHGFTESSRENCYDVVSEVLVRKLLDSLGELGR